MLINPLEIKEKDLPLICFIDDSRSFFGYFIRIHTTGQYSHVCEMVKPGKIATQDVFPGYREVSIKKYLKPRYRLKFVKYDKITSAEWNEWKRLVESELNQSWWRRKYDFLGIIGMGLGLRFINSPISRFCSERVATHLRYAINLWIKKHPSPSEINTLTKENGDFSVLGHWYEE